MLQASKLAPSAWVSFTEGEGDGYGGPLAVLFDESPASAAKDVMRKVLWMFASAWLHLMAKTAKRTLSIRSKWSAV